MPVAEVMGTIGIVKGIADLVSSITSSKNPKDGYNAGKFLNDASTLLTLKSHAMSISEQARRSIMMYPVLASSSLGDAKLVSNIAKYLEIQYATFTLISIGINHDTTNTTTAEQIMKISAENFRFSELATSSDFARASAEAAKPYTFNNFVNDGPRIGKGAKSTEAIVSQGTIQNPIPSTGNAKLDAYIAAFAQGMKEYSDASYDSMTTNSAKKEENRTINYANDKYTGVVTDFNKTVKNAKELEEKVLKSIDENPEISTIEKIKLKSEFKKYSNDIISNTAKSVQAASGDIEKMIDAKKPTKEATAEFMKSCGSLKAEPTLVKLKFSFDNRQNIEIPIAIKANVHPIGRDEMRMLLESGIEGRMPSIRVAKALSGEINMVKDLVFNMDIADRDQKLYKALGRHPWYQRLQERKMKSKFAIFNKQIKSMGAVLPTSTLVVTKDDLTLSTRIGYNNFLKNEKLMRGLLDSMYLLSIAVYDPELEQVSFFFQGFKDPFIYSVSEISKSGADPNKELNEALLLLSRKM